MSKDISRKLDEITRRVSQIDRITEIALNRAVKLNRGSDVIFAIEANKIIAISQAYMQFLYSEPYRYFNETYDSLETGREGKGYKRDLDRLRLTCLFYGLGAEPDNHETPIEAARRLAGQASGDSVSQSAVEKSITSMRKLAGPLFSINMRSRRLVPGRVPELLAVLPSGRGRPRNI